MTLLEWQDKSGEAVCFTDSGAVCVYYQPNGPYRVDLFHLSDYFVSSIAASIAWLTPRRSEPTALKSTSQGA